MAFKSKEDWQKWLAKNHGEPAGIWLQLAKKASGLASVTYHEALEIALCFGWIDGQKKPLDEKFWLQKFTPRRSRSGWSKVNRAKALLLVEQGFMQPAGLREIERAKADGRWEAAYDSAKTAVVPADLKKALAKSAEAKGFFATLDSANRYAILYRIQTAKKAETRLARIEQYVAMLARQEKLHPLLGKKSKKL
jgi:uncharacterized protein YdeI (YjbR/CyaY-like superfamily)